MSLPPDWSASKEEDSPNGKIQNWTDPDGEVRFAIETSETSQSLWALTTRLRRGQREGRSGFRVRSERFGNRWNNTRTWEFEFEYGDPTDRVRERRLYLDFGFAKTTLSFTASADRFAALSDRFDSIEAGLALAVLKAADDDTPPNRDDLNDGVSPSAPENTSPKKTSSEDVDSHSRRSMRVKLPAKPRTKPRTRPQSHTRTSSSSKISMN